MISEYTVENTLTMKYLKLLLDFYRDNSSVLIEFLDIE